MASHNFRGSHDQVQIEVKIQSLDSLGCTNDQQIQASHAIRTFITKDCHAARYQAGPHACIPADQTTLTSTACHWPRPRSNSVSYSTRCPGTNSLQPSRFFACTNESGPSPSGRMNPNPRVSFHELTVPIGI